MNFFISTSLVYFWIIAFVLFFAAFMISLLHSRADKRIYKSLVGVPMFVFYQVLSLLKVGKANQISVSTQHYYTKPLDELAEKNS